LGSPKKQPLDMGIDVTTYLCLRSRGRRFRKGSVIDTFIYGGTSHQIINQTINDRGPSQDP